MEQALVIGAGIAGLAVATGLRRVGWRVTVVEQASRLGEVGAGVTLWPNALRALEMLGFAEEVAALATRPYDGSLRDTRGRLLLRIDQTGLRRALGRPAVAVHRAHLHEMLLAAVDDQVRTGIRVTEARPDASVSGPGLSEGATGADPSGFDLVVGADGIDSRVRAGLWPAGATAAYSGYTAWRGICDPADLDEPTVVGARRDTESPGAAGITWGRGREFGVVPLADGRIYWYAAMRAPEGWHEPDERAAVLREFAWHRPIPAIVRATPPDRVLRNDLRHLPTPLATYRSGRVVLAGDAAHAMMPGLGQGACQALEDAAVLAYVCGQHDDLDRALARYDAERRPRSQRIARMSWQASRYGPLLGHPLTAGLRDLGMRLLPSSLMVRAIAGVSRWSPPGEILPAPASGPPE